MGGRVVTKIEFDRPGGVIVRLLRRIGMALGPLAMALALIVAASFVLPASAQAQSVTCSGGPVSAGNLSVRYVKATNTCTLSTDLSNLTGAGDFSMYLLSAAPPQMYAGRGLGASMSSLSFSVCNFGTGLGDFGAAHCGTTTFPDATDLTATFEWDSSNPGAPAVMDRRAVVNYRRDGVTMTIQSATVTVFGPEIAVTGNSVDITDGDTTPASSDHTDFGETETSSGTVSRTFTITNSGDATLNIASVALSGANSADFSITTSPATTVAASGGTTTVVVQFDPSATGTRIATLTINSDDADEAAFDFAIQGAGANNVTGQMIGDFLGARNGFILNNQPDGGRRIDRLNGGGGSGDSTASVSMLGFAPSVPSPISVSISNRQLSYAASASDAAAFLDARTGNAEMPDIGKWDIWAEGSFDVFADNLNQSGQFGIAHFGADYLVSEDILLGLKLQIDWMNQNFAATSGTVSGLGAMVGPYATIALNDNFYLDVSGAWGMSANDISPFATYTDRFWTSRVLLDASLIGQFEMDNWTIRPTLSASYISETSEAYTDALGAPISAQTVAQGEISFAPRVAYSFDLEDDATLTPWAEATGRYAVQTAGSPSAGSYASELLGLSGSLGAGIDLMLPSGFSFTLSGDYGGIFTNAQNYSGSIGISAPIN